MAGSTIWKSRPIFVSSTFSDMQAERDHLQDFVFPVLAERLRERRRHLEPIDLRWGVETFAVEEAHQKELLVLKVCLAEVERSRPFFVVLLGDRYGWVPPPERVAAAAAEAGFAGDQAGKSVTALEIEFGPLAPSDLRRSHFYFRNLVGDPLDAAVAAVFRDADPEARRKLTALKKRIAGELPNRCRNYTARWDAAAGQVVGLEEFGQRVLEDLWRDLDEATADEAARPAPDGQEADWAMRWELESFVADAGRGFQGRTAVADDLLRLALGPDESGRPWGACVTGVPGSGKSSLFAHLHGQLAREDVLLLAHAAGISVRAGRVDDLLRRWTDELAAFLGVDDPTHDDSSSADRERAFQVLLEQAARRRRVVLLIDALNQFEPTPRARHLTWLPGEMPANVRLIATAVPGVEARLLGQRPGVVGVELPPLTGDEAEAILRAVCARYHRTLNDEVGRELLARPHPAGGRAADSPLWVTVAAEELNRLDADDFARAGREFTGSAEERLHQLLLDVAGRLPGAIEDLYAWLLERAEQVVPAGWVRALTGLLAVSRQGLRESDLRALLPGQTGEPWSDLTFAALRRALRPNVVLRGGSALWDFFHAQMREAVRRRYLADEANARRLHAGLAEHLGGLPPADPLRQAERMFHLIGSRDRARTADYYSTLVSDRHMERFDTDMARLGLARDPSAPPRVNLPTEAEVEAGNRVMAAFILAGESLDPDGLSGPNPNLDWVLSLLPHGDDDRGLGAEGIRLLCNRFTVELHDQLERVANPVTISRLAQRVQEVLAGSATGPASYYELLYLAFSHGRQGDAFMRAGGRNLALLAYRHSEAILRRLVVEAPGHEAVRNLAVVLEKIGDALDDDLPAALAAYEESRDLREQLDARGALAVWPEFHRDLVVIHQRVGNVRRRLGDLDGALNANWRSLTAAEKFPGGECDVPRIYLMIGDLLWKRGDRTEALLALEAGRTAAIRLVERDPADLEAAEALELAAAELADRHDELGNRGQALACAQQAVEVAARLVALKPREPRYLRRLASACRWLGMSHQQAGETGAALPYWRHCYEALRGLRALGAELSPLSALGAALSPQLADLLGQLEAAFGQKDELALGHAALAEVVEARDTGDPDRGIGHARDAFAHFAAVLREQPHHAAAARGLAVASYHLGAFLMGTGAVEEGQQTLAVSHQLLRQLCAAGELDEPAAQLLARLDQVERE